ncbi:MAG: copper chaperone PCu(A)C [Hyphomicrobiaceae bacterium]
MMRIAAVSLFITFVTLGLPTAHSGDISVGDLIIERPWARATMKIAEFGVGYINIINIGPNPDRLKSATTEISERVEIHNMTLTNAGMQQRLVADGLELGARSVTDLKPGGTHLRFVGLKRPLRKEHSFNVRLDFEKAGPVDVLFLTTEIGGKSPYPDAINDVSGSASGSRSRGGNN